MAKKSWDDLVTLHPNSRVYSAGPVSTRIPALSFDAAGKKLPTPYGLFQKWLASNLSEAWASQTGKGVILVRVADPQDAAMLVGRFGPAGPARKTPASRSTIPLRYTDADYEKLAIELGYTPKK